MKNAMSLSLILSLGVMLASVTGCGGEAPAPATPTTEGSPTTKAADKDTDGDGIPDSADKCPDKKEDGQAPDPKDGCPKP